MILVPLDSATSCTYDGASLNFNRRLDVEIFALMFQSQLSTKPGTFSFLFWCHWIEHIEKCIVCKFYQRIPARCGDIRHDILRLELVMLGGVHQKLLRLQAWNAGATTVIRDRHNIRASQRNRKNFPTLGYYEHYLVGTICK